jgi:UPF0755 protein
MKQIIFWKKVLFSGVAIIIVITFATLINTYKKIYQPNVIIKGSSSCYLYIPTGSNLDDVCRILYQNNFIRNRSSFEWLAEKKHYQHNIKAGKYKLQNRMSNNELISILRSGKQEAVKLTFNEIDTKEQLAGIISHQIEADSSVLINFMNNDNFLDKYGFKKETVIGMFIPNTYEFLWNTSVEGFFNRMNKEYKKFWNDTRTNNSRNIGFSSIEVITLASIVEKESNITDEYPIIAGVYINRLRKGLPLQADPTIKFAIGDLSIKRIRERQLGIDSPYNTYKHNGLPPGPITIPSIKAIDAVLNFKQHSYLYFCAKSDFSGRHVFAKTLEQHNLNARLYQQALDRKRILD